MRGIDFVEHDDAKSLRAILRALPDGTNIISVYTRPNGAHYAWYQLPQVATVTPIQSESTVEKQTFKKGKIK